MKLFYINIYIIFLCLVAAGQTNWTIDYGHSQVGFTVTHMVISEVEGSFKKFEGTVTTEGQDFTTMNISVTIDAASVFTNNDRRDSHLRGPDFFYVEKYPNLTFKSSKVEKSGDNQFRIFGDLTIRDKTNPIILNTKMRGPITDYRGNTRVGFKATGSLNRFDYDLNWNNMLETGELVASKEVEITINVELSTPAK